MPKVYCLPIYRSPYYNHHLITIGTLVKSKPGVAFHTQPIPQKSNLWNMSRGSNLLYFDKASWSGFLSVSLQELGANQSLLSSSRDCRHPIGQVRDCSRKYLGPLQSNMLERVRPHIEYMGTCLVLGYSLSLIIRHFRIFQQGPQDSTTDKNCNFI